MPQSAGLVLRAGTLAGVGLVILYAGYLTGNAGIGRRTEGNVRGGERTPAVPGLSELGDVPDAPEDPGDAANLTKLPTRAAYVRTWALYQREARRPSSSLRPETLRAHQDGTAELHNATAALLAEVVSELSADPRMALGKTEGLLSIVPGRVDRLLEAIKLLAGVEDAVHAALQAVLPLAAERQARTAAGKVGSLPGPSSPLPPRAEKRTILVTVAEKPFGMHLKRGRTRVEEVFPGFPAQAAGVREGCELIEVAGTPVSSGTWLRLFEETPLPFGLKLACGGGADAAGGASAVEQDKSRYRVMVAKKPFGMNVQVHVLPRVTEVLPGYPAEAAGVRRGFVLTEVNDKKVGAQDWFEAYQRARLPFTLTFDTEVPLHKGNDYFVRKEDPGLVAKAAKAVAAREKAKKNATKAKKTARGAKEYVAKFMAERMGRINNQKKKKSKEDSDEDDEDEDDEDDEADDEDEEEDDEDDDEALLEDEEEEEEAGKPPAAPRVDAALNLTELLGASHEDFRYSVEKLPLGMQVHAPPHAWPRVIKLLAGSPAEKAGVRVGDVLLEVAGRRVNSTTWFAAIQQSVLPYGLLFRRPTNRTNSSSDRGKGSTL